MKYFCFLLILVVAFAICESRDEDDGDTQSRYPSIPSLVALQMMKNRLQLANLGKRLMKWSAMATGKELRKRAWEMNEEFRDYGDQVANAFLLLARARFYNPNLNKTVLENVGRRAACVVDFEIKTLIGVRFFAMTVIERDHDSNLHLGLEKGGAAIASAKKAWRDLLIEMVLLLENTTAFQRIFASHKSATKKQNVLGKVIIPKITNAIAYIKAELEEKEREETFRLKRFKHSKQRKMEAARRPKTEPIPEEPEIDESTRKPDIIIIKRKVKKSDIPEAKPKRVVPKLRDIISEKSMSLPLSKPMSVILSRNLNEPCAICIAQIKDTNRRLQHLIEHVTQFILLCKQKKINFPTLETSNNNLSYTNIKQKLDDVCTTCTHNFTGEKTMKGVCTCAPLAGGYCVCGPPPKKNSICECPSPQLSTESLNCKATQTDGGNIAIFSCDCWSHSAVANDECYEQYSKWPIDLMARFDRVYLRNTPSRTSTSQRGGTCHNDHTQTIKYICTCISPESPVSLNNSITKRDNSSETSTNSPYFKKSPIYFTSVPQTHYSSFNRKLDPYYTPKTITDTSSKYVGNVLQNIESAVAIYAPESISGPYRISDIIYTSDWTNVPSPKDFATVATYQPHTFYTPYTQEDKFDSYDIFDTFNAVDSSNTVIRSDSLTCMTVLPQGYSPRVMPYMGRLGLTGIINTDLTDNPIYKDFSTVNDHQKYKCCMPYTREGMPGPCGLPGDNSSLLLVNKYSTSRNTIGTASIFDISDTEINEDNLTGVVSQKDAPLESQTQNDTRPDECNISEPIYVTRDIVTYKNFSIYIILSPDQNWPLRSSAREETHENNSKDCYIGSINTARSPNTQMSKDYSIYVTLTPEKKSRIKHSRTYVMPASSNISDRFNSANSHDTFYKDNATYVTTVHRKHKRAVSCTPCVKCGTSFKTGAFDSTDTIQFSRGVCGVFDVCSTICPEAVSSAISYTREGRPGPCSIAEVTNITESKPVTSSTPYTREGRPGPFDIINTICPSFTSAIPYTREGRPGPCGITEMTNITVSKPITSATPYTREGRPRPFDVVDISNTICPPVTSTVPYTREGRPGPCGITGSKPVTSLEPYTRESKPGPCGILDTENITCPRPFRGSTSCKHGRFRSSDIDTTATKQFELPISYTREGRPGPSGIPVMSNICSSKQVTSSLQYTREERAELHGISDANNITITKQLGFPIPHTREGRPGHCGISGISSINARKISKSFMPYTREGRPGRCGVSEMSNASTPITPNTQQCCFEKCGAYKVICVFTSEETTKLSGVVEMSSITASKHITSSTPYTREGRPGPCGIPKMNNSSPSQNYPVTSSTPYTREGRPGPVGISETSNITDSKSVTSSTPYTREGRSGPVCISEMSNFTTTYTREGRPGPFGISDMSHCLPDQTELVLSSTPCTRNSRPGTCCTSKMSNITASKPAPYTREGKPGQCGIFDTSNLTCPKQVTRTTQYKRQGIPGPCGICKSNNITPTKQFVAPTPYTCERRPEPCGIISPIPVKPSTANTRMNTLGPCGVCETSNNTASKPVPSSTSYTREGRPGPFDICNMSSARDFACPTPYTGEDRPGPFNISEMSSITATKPLPRPTIKVFMATTSPCHCANNGPYAQKDTPCSETDRKNNQAQDLGCIETEYKKFTKICRYKNPDGTIVDEKRITIIKNKKMKPSCYQDQDALGFDKSTCISEILESETNICSSCKQSMSENLRSTAGIIPCPRIKYSISTLEFKKVNGNRQKFENFKDPNQSDAKSYVNRLKDSAGSPKCDCKGKAPPKSPHLVCANKLVDSNSVPNSKFGREAPPEPPPLVCANRLEDAGSDSKYGSGVGALPKPPPVVCANRLEDSDSGPKCDCGEGAPPKAPPLVCANRLEDSDSGPKCDCGGGAPLKAPPLVCANRLEDSDSGPKCDCGGGAPPKAPPLVCANRLEDTDSGPKCDCGGGAPPKASPLVCANRLEDTDSGPKCDCGGGEPPKAPIVCANRLEDSDSGPKCDCGGVAPPTAPPLVCANRLEDSDSGPKCDCGGVATPTAPPLVCANRLEDSDSGPKCDCGGGAPPKAPPLVCANRLEDSDSGPKCDCGGGAPPKAPLVGANRLEDSDSGPRCDYAGEAPPKSPDPIRPNTFKDSASGTKCECKEGPAPPKSPPLVHNNTRRLQDLATDTESEETFKAIQVNADTLRDTVINPPCECNGGAFNKYAWAAISKKFLEVVLGINASFTSTTPPKSSRPKLADKFADTSLKFELSNRSILEACALCGSQLRNRETCTPNDNPSCSCHYILPLKSTTTDNDKLKDTVCDYTGKSNKIQKNTASADLRFGCATLKSNDNKLKCTIQNKNKCPGKPAHKINISTSTIEQRDAISTSMSKNKDDSESFCTIQIITKSPKKKCCGTEYESHSFTATSSTLDALRQMFKSPHLLRKFHKRNKNICKTCYSPLSGSISSDLSNKVCPLCELCQDKLVQENERGFRCTNYGAESGSSRSATVGSGTRSSCEPVRSCTKNDSSAHDNGTNCNL